MSYELSNSEPKVLLRSEMFENAINFGDYRIPMNDFCYAVIYALTNSDLYPNDPRLDLIEKIKKSTIVDGWNINREPDCKKIKIESTKTNE